MNKNIKIGDKLGCLNPKNGRYEFNEVVSMNESQLTLLRFHKVGGRLLHTIYEEKTPEVIQWLKQESPDFKDGRTLLKHKGTRCNHVTKAQERYLSTLK